MQDSKSRRPRRSIKPDADGHLLPAWSAVPWRKLPLEQTAFQPCGLVFAGAGDRLDGGDPGDHRGQVLTPTEIGPERTHAPAQIHSATEKERPASGDPGYHRGQVLAPTEIGPVRTHAPAQIHGATEIERPA